MKGACRREAKQKKREGEGGRQREREGERLGLIESLPPILPPSLSPLANTQVPSLWHYLVETISDKGDGR